MKCPKCGREMENGFLQWDAAEGITWVSKLLPIGLAYWKTDAVHIQSQLGVGISAVPAHICKPCKLFIGDYNSNT